MLALLVGNASEAQQQIDNDARSGRDKTLEVVHTSAPPIIDGVMDEIWASGALIEDLHQVLPIEYSTPSEKTTVRILYDSDFLYVSAMLYYEDVDDIVANRLVQGEDLRGDDKFRVLINPFDDGRNGYVFQSNANGIRFEGILENVTDINWAWSGIWYAEVQRTDYGWFAEYAIPYKTIAFDPTSSNWGLSVYRTVEGKSEVMAWTSYNRNVDPTNFGSLLGMENLNQGIGLDVIPGASATYRRQYQPSNSDSEFEPTLDAFYKFTPNLTGALTINSDFSATDVDARQVQLSRFSIFFPEQRKFFLQEADIFEFGGLDDNGKPFFSRRIGIGPSGEQLDLEVGGKLTGRIGRWNVGALAVQQDGNAGEVPDGGQLVGPSDLFVGRVAANVLEQSTLGAIVTHGDPNSDLDNNLVGADFNYLNTRSFENVTIDGQVWYQESDTEGATGDESAWGAKIRSPNEEGWLGKYEYWSIGEAYNPALGFANRVGIKKNEAGLGYTKRLAADSRIRSLSTFWEWQRYTDTDGNLETELFDVKLIGIENQFGDELDLFVVDNREVLTEPFEIVDGIIIPVGDYSFTTYGAELETSRHRTLQLEIEVEDGEFYNGDIRSFEAKVRWQPSKHFRSEIEFEYNDIDLIQGDFETRLLRLRTDVAFSAKWAWIMTAQYDNQSDVLGVNSRLQWIPEAGREFYVIYNGGWIDEPMRGFDTIGESATIKLNHTFRF